MPGRTVGVFARVDSTAKESTTLSDASTEVPNGNDVMSTEREIKMI